MLTRCVFISEEGTISDVSINIDANEHGKMLGGDITFVGQIEHSVYGPVVFMKGNKSLPVSNPHRLPYPLQNEVVNGPMICMRIDGGVDQHFTTKEYVELFE